MAFENDILTSLTSDSALKLFAQGKKEGECLIRNANLSMTAKSIRKELVLQCTHISICTYIANDKRKVKRSKKVNPSYDTFQQ